MHHHQSQHQTILFHSKTHPFHISSHSRPPSSSELHASIMHPYNFIMSIYSGFATRNLQQFYDRMLYNLLSTLLLRVTKIYKREQVDEAAFLKIVLGHEKNLRKMEKRKYLEPKYSELLTAFKKEVQEEEPPEQPEERIPRGKGGHELNRTLSLLGKEFGELRANFDQYQKIQRPQLSGDESQPSLAKIAQRRKNPSKRKRKEKKGSIRSNLDLWDMRQEKTPELPSLHPLQALQRTIMSKTKFNNFSERVRSKEIDEYPNDQEPQSLRNVLTKPPKFRAKMYFK